MAAATKGDVSSLHVYKMLKSKYGSTALALYIYAYSPQEQKYNKHKTG